MKKLYLKTLFIALSFILPIGLYAKTGVKIYYSNGSVKDIPSDEIDHIEYYQDNDEQEDEGDEGEEANGFILSSVDGYELTYDNQGRLTSYHDTYTTVKIDYEQGIMIIDDDEIVNFELNDKGLLSKFSSSYHDGPTTSNQNIHFTYNDNNNLVKIESSYFSNSGSYVNEEEESFTADCIWENGCMIAARVNYTSFEEGELDYDDTYEYEINYSETPNKYRQLPFIISDDILDMEAEFGVLCAVGMIGKGPVYLPDYIVETDGDGRTTKKVAAYILNPNGTIKTETINENNRIDYYYQGDETNVSLAQRNHHSKAKREYLKLFVKNK